MTFSFSSTLSKKILTALFLILTITSFGQEICNNGSDDDNDGLIDLNDTVDCVCGVVTPTAVPSMIPNPSFEAMDYCPSTYSQLNAATGWVQATGATSDYYNTCGYVFPAAGPAGLVPFPHGNGIVGAFVLQDYKEYIGSCLLSPMLAGTQYKITFDIASLLTDDYLDVCTSGSINSYGPLDITIFGTSTCTNMPVPGFGQSCPPSLNTGWNVLGTVNYTPSINWGTATITFTPSYNVNAIIIGSPCTLPPSYPSLSSTTCYPYFVFDNLTLNDAAAFGAVNISSTGNYCTNNIQLTANITTTVSSSATLQWYLNGVAIVGATGSTYNVPVGAAGLGDYVVKLTDGTVCALSNEFMVTSNPPAITVNSPSVCPTSTVTLTASSACTSYTWSTGSNGTSITVAPAATTIYTVNGTIGTCTAQATSTVTIFTSSISVTGNTVVCAGQSTTLTANGATNYTWNESGGPTLNSYFTSVVVSTPNTSTTYTVNGSSGAGASFCTSQAIITVSVIPSPSITISPANSSICAGSTLTLTASLTGASTQTWSTGSTSPSIVVSPTTNTTYTAYTSAGSCTVPAYAYVYMDPGPTVSVNSPTICYGETATLSANGATSYTWSTGSNNSSIAVTPTSNSVFTVSGSTGASCVSTATSTVSVTHPIADFSGINESTYPVGTTLNLISISSNATNYQWKLCDGTISTNTTVSIALKDEENCCIKLVASQSNCIDSITKCFTVVPESFMIIPNVFTPNGDGKNDLFRVTSTGITAFNCSIFDRWGLKLFEWNDVKGYWDGKAKSGLAPSGTYFFIINYTDSENNSKTEKGFLSLFRD